MAAPSTKTRAKAAKAEDKAPKDEKVTETPDAAKESERERKAKEKAEAEAKARAAKIESGDLIVTDGREFEAGTKETRVSGQVAEIIEKYQASEVPLVFSEVVESIGAKYPEDLIPSMHALETLGLVRRFDARPTGEGQGNRRSAAYLWVGDAA
jgi:hypothetical protein